MTWTRRHHNRQQDSTTMQAGAMRVRRDMVGRSIGCEWNVVRRYKAPRVWQPEQCASNKNSDPYSNGAWVWYPNSGYIWASNYSWGSASFTVQELVRVQAAGLVGLIIHTGYGGADWGFFGGVARTVNIVIGPTGYRPIRVPVVVGRPVRHDPSGAPNCEFAAAVAGSRSGCRATADCGSRSAAG